jgi:decaprenylphospho-beta-D-erythro-pentofuranosid-2-ulose 2-reductase
MKILIFGATSAVAQSFAAIYAKKGADIYLAGRTLDKLESVASNLKVLGAKNIYVKTADHNKDLENGQITSDALGTLGELDIVLVAQGLLGDQEQGEKNFAIAYQIIEANYLSQVSILTHLTPIFEKQGSGVIAVISSVAGDRGRRSNFIYGSAKAGLSAYLSGLRQYLGKSNVTVLTVKPGPIDSPMTAHMKKGPIWSTPEKVASDIAKAVERKSPTLYTPWFWYFIMTIIKLIPEKVFKKLSF